MNESDANSTKRQRACPGRFAQWLIQRAAQSGPASLSERLQEEWSADLATRSSAISRLRFALGCCLATRVIAYQHRPARVAAGTSALMPKGVITAGFPNSADYYPQVAKLMEERGAVTVSVCVDTNGRLTASPTVVQTSGSSRLDGGALSLAKAGSGRYRPTTEDGRAVNSCYPFRVRFELRK